MPATAETETVWLSGPILTFLNKLLLPGAWFAIVVGTPLWVYLTVGRISIRQDFRFIVVFVLVATVLLSWFTAHLQSVGYRGRELLVSNYWRQARIPFDEVESVEPVWWYRNRVVRIRFRRATPFGTVVYYLPKWGPVLALSSAPEEKLRNVISDSLR